ncbi:MAG TPA: TlpA disulfide reductase family protein [Isosphaeraceae bacterium]|nr:TlpA disulfide reductase family protein [Isosphaeraceae bacterium]
MNYRFRRVAMLSLGCVLASAALALGADRPASEILKDIDAVKMPALDRSKLRDRVYVQEYVKQREEATKTRDKLILELYKAAPDNERIPTLMAQRWGSTPPGGPRIDALIKEIDNVLAHTKNDKLKVEGTYFKAQAQLFKARQHGEGKLDTTAIDAFIQLAPKDPRAGSLIYVAAMSASDPKTKTALEDRILKEYPDSQFTSMIKGARRQREGIGKPFELEFTDASSGSTISMGTLKGKVVVVDFWATWCGPCVAELPAMKKLYEKFHGQGVEFLGVSLDKPKQQGGLDALKKFVKEQEIPWPQYYQGKGGDSDFSRSWGIYSIPTMFLVDQEGKLVSVEARGKLAELIPGLLAKKTKKTPAGGR